MSPTELTTLLHREIPLAAAIGLRVENFSELGLQVSGPFAANQNLHGTLFAGSIYCFATLASWTLVHALCQEASLPAAVVLQEGNIRYLKPITDSPQALANMPEPSAKARFLQMLRERGKGRLSIEASLTQGGEPAAIFIGQFVAIREHKP